MSGHPSRVTLEQYLLTPEAVSERAHLESCPECGERLAALRRSNEEFRQYLQPRGMERAVEAAIGARRRNPLRWLVGGLAPVLALALVLVVTKPWNRGPTPDYVGVKGRALKLDVFTEGHDGPAQRAEEGGRVASAARVRFALATDRPCWLWLLSVDASGHVSRIFPVEGEGAARVEHSGPLPGGGELDGSQGPERFVAVCTGAALPWGTVERAASQAFGGGAEQVRHGGPLGGLPADASVTTRLLEKAGW